MVEVKTLYANLPNSPGVYLMKDAKGRILYIGKAGNLRRRVSSYFLRSQEYRIERLIKEIKKVDHQKTDTAIEALILESELIKKEQPPYNVREKDDKSWLFVEITKEAFPRVLLARGKEIRQLADRRERFGPFTSATSIREALQIIRKIFPYSVHPADMKPQSRPCFDYSIGLCPGTCVGAILRDGYLKNIRNIRLFFRGKKSQILRSLKKEMTEASKRLEFEKAAEYKRQLFSLQHIQDVALISENGLSLSIEPRASRIEGYDISNISGTSAVGSMVVFHGREPEKGEYRKFKIRTIQESNDVGMLKEVLRRRFGRYAKGETGWALPDLILIDGGKGQVNAVREVLDEVGLKIPVVGIAKGPERKRNDVVGKIPNGFQLGTLIRVRDEAHRFAISYHKNLRGKQFLA